VLQINKDIPKVWHYAALQWHNITTKIPKISDLLPDLWWLDKRQYSDPRNPCLKKSPFSRRNRVYISKKINVHVGKNYRAIAYLLDESLSFRPIIGLAALDLQYEYSLSIEKPV
jgi:hypothetical protein